VTLHVAGDVLMVPTFDEGTPWPTLGPQVCDFIEAYLVFGPGDLRGQPARLDPEKRGLIYRAYEVYPADHPKAGRRRFKRVGISKRKGTAKTEWAAWIAAVELHPDGPVRCDGFDADGNPVGIGIVDPYIPMVAYTEEQSEDLAYGALRIILENSKIADDFDIGLERIVRKDGDGKAVPLASSPDARDGARTTFQHFDETHRFTLGHLRAAHKTMLANIPKRKKSDAWSLETTTAPAPGEGSVAESTMEYAKAIHDGRRKDADLFFFHRQAADGHDLTTPAGARAAVLEASGPDAEWSDIDGIVAQFADPTSDLAYLERVWTNRLVRSTDKAFDVVRWRELEKQNYVIPDGALVALGFDGSRHLDSTAIVATEIPTGFQQVVGLWERPLGPAGEKWEVPVAEVKAAMTAAFARWKVWKLYADPPYWETVVDEWAGELGEERVVKWLTRLWHKTADACRAFANAILAGELSHAGDERYTRHVGNAYRMVLHHRQEDGQAVWVIQKERSDSPNKIDVAMAGVLSWQARRDALADGAGKGSRSMYENRVPLALDDDGVPIEEDDDVLEEAAAPEPSFLQQALEGLDDDEDSQ
jgi:hypothetical protein